MATIRYVRIDTASGAGEVLSDALAGIGSRNRRIRALWPAFDAASAISSAVSLRMYVDQTQIVDFYLDAMAHNLTSNNRWCDVLRRIPVEVDIKEGQGVKVGFHHASSTPAGSVTVEYEEP